MPIFVISTFESDYVLVREPDLARAADALADAGHVGRPLDARAAPRLPWQPMTPVSRSWWAWRSERGGSLRSV